MSEILGHLIFFIKKVNLSFGTNRKFSAFRCPNTYAHHVG